MPLALGAAANKQTQGGISNYTDLLDQLSQVPMRGLGEVALERDLLCRYRVRGC